MPENEKPPAMRVVIYYRLRAAGVKRAEIISPVFAATNRKQVAVAGNVKVTFGGLEDE